MEILPSTLAKEAPSALTQGQILPPNSPHFRKKRLVDPERFRTPVEIEQKVWPFAQQANPIERYLHPYPVSCGCGELLPQREQFGDPRSKDHRRLAFRT